MRAALIVTLMGLGLVGLGGCGQPDGSGGAEHPTADATPRSAPQGRLAIERLGRKGQISVSSTDFMAGSAIPTAFSAYGANRKPQLDWSPVTGAASYALIVEDPDAPSAKPHVHDLEWAIAQPGGLGGAAGRNDAGGQGWSGPHPPQGDNPHHYHFEVFALDAAPRLKPGADRDALVAAMRGHVLADGELTATYKAP